MSTSLERQDSTISEDSTINMGFMGTHKTKHVKYGVQCGFGTTAVITSIVFMATGGSSTIWLPVLTSTIAYFLPQPTY